MAERTLPQEPVLPDDRPANMTDILSSQQMMFGHPAAIEDDEEPMLPGDELPDDAPPPAPEPTPAAAEPPEEWEPKYANQREAERASQEAQRRMTEATQEAADLRRQLAERDRREQEILARMEALEQAQQTPPQPAPAPEEEFDPAAYIREHGYKVAAQLDPNLDDYTERSQEIVSRAQGEAMLRMQQINQQRAQQSPQLQPEQIREIIREELRVSQEQDRQQQQVRSVRQQLLDAATTAGLDVREPQGDDPGGVHYADLMWIAGRNPRPRGQEAEAISETVQAVMQRHGISAPQPPAPPANPQPPVAPAHPAVRPAPPAAPPPSPMERSTGHVPTPQPDVMDERPLQMEEIMGMVQDTRVIGGR